jgi:hypothetical protein
MSLKNRQLCLRTKEHAFLDQRLEKCFHFSPATSLPQMDQSFLSGMHIRRDEVYAATQNL